MSNREVAGLQALAKKHGGELTINPDTGLPEAGFLDSLIPTIAGAGLSYFSGGAITPMMAAGIVGGISALESKDLGKGLMAGLGAYGGGSMVGGFAGMGLGEGVSATATAPAQEAAMQAAIKEGTYQNAVGKGASSFGSMFANKPMETIASFGGGSGLNAGRTLFAAAAPAIMADQNVKTTTPAPDRGMIRPQTFSRQRIPQDYQEQQENMGSRERRYFNDLYTPGDPYTAANGGLVALAAGGYAGRGEYSTGFQELIGPGYREDRGENRIPDYERFLPRPAPTPLRPPNRGYDQQDLFKPTNPLPANNMTGASRDAYDYLMGNNTIRTFDKVGGTGGTDATTGRQTLIRGGTGGKDVSLPNPNPNPNTPQTGKGKYKFDPITQRYTWIPDPVKPVDTTKTVVETTERGGGGGGDRGTDGFDGGSTNTSAEGNGFSPTSQQAYDVSRFGQQVGYVSPIAGALIGSYGNYLAGNVDPNYSHEGLNAGSAPTQSTNDGTAGEQAAQDALADGTAAAGLQASYDKITSASSPTATGGEIQNPQTIVGITAADAMREAAENKEAEAANIRSMLASQVDSGDAMQRALDSQNLSQQNNLAGLSTQQAIDNQNATFSALSPTATGGIANGGDSIGSPFSGSNMGVGALPGGSDAPPSGIAAISSPAANPMGVDPAGIAALAQAQERADITAAQAAANDRIAQAEAQAKAEADARADAAREQAARDAVKQAEAKMAADAAAAAKAAADAAKVQMVNVVETYQGDDPNPPGGWTRVSLPGKDNFKHVRTVSVKADSAAAKAAAARSGGGGGGGYTVGGYAPGSQAAAAAASGQFAMGPGTPGFNNGMTGERGGGGGGGDRSNSNPGDSGRGGGGAHLAQGGLSAMPNHYNLGSYSDGGRLLRGPGDGVSDSIPATIGRGQPARLADGEFVIPARIVSELGNGSTDAGARELYKMMDRIQAGRRKTVGKKQVAKNSKAARHLPA
jgi:hypothetical protein